MNEVRPPVPYCSHCSRYMTLVRSLPKLGGMPELDTYRCAGCGNVQTIEVLVAHESGMLGSCGGRLNIF
jgi:hypothetical protein